MKTDPFHQHTKAKTPEDLQGLFEISYFMNNTTQTNSSVQD